MFVFYCMNKKLILSEISKRKDRLKAKGVKRIGLFGSYLKGEQKRGSDIDLLVEFDNETAGNYFGLWTYFENLFGRKVDLVISGDLRKELNHVKKEAIYVTI